MHMFRQQSASPALLRRPLWCCRYWAYGLIPRQHKLPSPKEYPSACVWRYAPNPQVMNALQHACTNFPLPLLFPAWGVQSIVFGQGEIKLMLTQHSEAAFYSLMVNSQTCNLQSITANSGQSHSVTGLQSPQTHKTFQWKQFKHLAQRH